MYTQACCYPSCRGGKTWLPLPQRRQDAVTPPPEEARHGCPSPRGGKMWLLSTGCGCTPGSFGLGMDNKACSVIHGWGTINGLWRHLQCLLVQLTVMAEHILMCSCMPGMITNHNFNMTRQAPQHEKPLQHDAMATWHALPLRNQSEMWYI